MELTQQQNKVFERIKAFMMSDASVFILRGYAGTGKTTMVKVIADYIAKSRDVMLMAPTGRAARVLKERTGHEASTIHRAIYDRAYIKAKKVNDLAESEYQIVFPIAHDDFGGKIVAIVDEASMLCSRKTEHEQFVFGTDNLMEDLLTFVRPAFGGKVIFVGDPAQLPPVGENVSNALRADFFREHGLKVMEEELTEVLRQEEGSVILKNAMMIRDLLEKEKRNNLVFAEKKDEVETVASGDFLNKYLECRKERDEHDCVIICYSNKAASRYNQDIRAALYGNNVPINTDDTLLVAQNNYRLGRMNGDLIPVLDIGPRIQQSAPVYAQVGGRKERITITMSFIQVTLPNDKGIPMTCMLLEDFLTSDKNTLSVDENRALYINFCIRHPELKEGTEAFTDALLSDPYYNAVRAKYGYAVTGHKCQGGEWEKVFVDFTGRTGLNDDCLRWAYTATTRARKTLFVTNLPHVTPFSTFQIAPIQQCKNMEAECQVIAEAAATPFHGEHAENYLKAKYHCIADNMAGTPYSIHRVDCKPYMEIYQIQTPDGLDRFDIRYKKGGIFLPAKAATQNRHTQQVCMMLDDERRMPLTFDYRPTDEIHEQLYNLVRSACDSLSVRITNVVEHQEDFSVVFYMRTSGTFSYIKAYFNNKGFVTYAKPMSMLGTEDSELRAVLNEISNHLT